MGERETGGVTLSSRPLCAHPNKRCLNPLAMYANRTHVVQHLVGELHGLVLVGDILQPVLAGRRLV